MILGGNQVDVLFFSAMLVVSVLELKYGAMSTKDVVFGMAILNYMGEKKSIILFLLNRVNCIRNLWVCIF